MNSICSHFGTTTDANVHFTSVQIFTMHYITLNAVQGASRNVPSGTEISSHRQFD